MKFEMILPLKLTFHSSFHLQYLFGETCYLHRMRWSFIVDARWIVYSKKRPKRLLL